MTLLKFSVITPSLNQAPFLEQNIQSVQAQHYPAVEHIVIDGGSADGTVRILEKYPHLQWVSEPDRGQSHAVNKGLKRASGDVVGWINSDDGYLPDVFQDVARCFADPSVMVVYGDGIEVDIDGKTTRSIIPRGISTDQFVRYWRWQYDYIQASFFFRRNVFDEVGLLDESLFYNMDHDLFIRLSRRFRFHYIPKPLAYYRLHQASKTGSTNQRFIPKYIWELHRVSIRYWGSPARIKFYRFAFSFLGAIVFSALKNIFFVPGSKSRTRFFR